jgi:flagellar hook-associated protein 1 FlgK
VGDNRNARLLGALQTTNILDNKSATFQSSYAELVSYVGNKAREVQVNGQAGAALLTQATESQQSVSGVNLDEEAANLIKYQQAYQAAGKVMQIAGTLFDTLLSIGR